MCIGNGAITCPVIGSLSLVEAICGISAVFQAVLIPRVNGSPLEEIIYTLVKTTVKFFTVKLDGDRCGLLEGVKENGVQEGRSVACSILLGTLCFLLSLAF